MPRQNIRPLLFIPSHLLAMASQTRAVRVVCRGQVNPKSSSLIPIPRTLKQTVGGSRNVLCSCDTYRRHPNATTRAVCAECLHGPSKHPHPSEIVPNKTSFCLGISVLEGSEIPCDCEHWTAPERIRRNKEDLLPILCDECQHGESLHPRGPRHPPTGTRSKAPKPHVDKADATEDEEKEEAVPHCVSTGVLETFTRVIGNANSNHPSASQSAASLNKGKARARAEISGASIAGSAGGKLKGKPRKSATMLEAKSEALEGFRPNKAGKGSEDKVRFMHVIINMWT